MWKSWAIFIGLGFSLVAGQAGDSKKSSAADALFNGSTIRTFQLEVPEAGLAALRQGNHAYVRGTLREGGVVLRDVGVRLKGHASFQPVDRKPSFALKLNEFVSGQEYCGLGKLVFNNSAQDASYLREQLAARLYQDAGLPAPRITHACVQFNGRDLGLYVLVEPTNKGFLKREFGAAGGNLYEGETKDMDQKLDQENGDDTSQRDLQALVTAAKAPVAGRMEKLRAVLDVDGFASFLAMEMLTAGIDGYAFTRNNYRIYHHPTTGRLVFFPHGLDATFGSAGFQPPTNSLLVRALWELPEFQKQYQTKLGELGQQVWKLEVLTNRVQSAVTKLINAAPTPALAAQIEREAKTLCHQMTQQQQFIATEIKRGGKK